MTSLALLFTLSAIGISETVYLVKKRVKAESPVCVFGEECNIVLGSKYNRIFIAPNDILGLVFYIIIAFILAMLVIGQGPVVFLSLAMKILIIFGSLMSFVFTWLQWRVIRAWCFWCLMSAFTIWFMGVTILIAS